MSLPQTLTTIFLASTLLSSAITLAANGVKPAQEFVYAASVWTGDEKSGATLRYLGVFPLESCYLAGATFEEMKRCANPF